MPIRLKYKHIYIFKSPPLPDVSLNGDYCGFSCLKTQGQKGSQRAHGFAQSSEESTLKHGENERKVHHKEREVHHNITTFFFKL